MTHVQKPHALIYLCHLTYTTEISLHVANILHQSYMYVNDIVEEAFDSGFGCSGQGLILNHTTY